MKDFIENPDFLGDLTLYITMPLGLELHHLSPLSKLKMVEKYFDYVEKKIKANYMKERGTPVFEGVSMPELINDYYIELNRVRSEEHTSELQSRFDFVCRLLLDERSN